jgi:DNA-binding transcriptional ArsR family regulator
LADVRAGTIDIVLVYKVDRLTRSLADFAKLIELFDAHDVSFVSVTQSFNTSSSMGRLTLNVLLSFAQFERELIGERVRDKIADVLALAPGADGALWIGTYGGGLVRLDKDGRWQTYSGGANTKGGLPNDQVRALAPGADGALWIGTYGGGLVRLDKDGRWQTYSNANTHRGLPDDNVLALAPGADGALWIGTNGGGFARLALRARGGTPAPPLVRDSCSWPRSLAAKRASSAVLALSPWMKNSAGRQSGSSRP